MKTTGDRPSDALQTRFTPLQTPSNPGSDAVSHSLKCLQTTSDGPFTLSPYIPPARLKRPTRPSKGRSQAFQTPTSSFTPIGFCLRRAAGPSITPHPVVTKPLAILVRKTTSVVR